MCSNDLLKTLSNRLAELEELVSTQPTLDYLDEINRTKSKIEDIYNERARGCIIRTRSKFTEEYEKPTKFFLNLEKANINKKHIRSLIIADKIIKKPDEILSAQREFYSKLYTCPPNNVSNECIDKYLFSCNLPQISKTSKEICDRPICLEEVKKAILELKNNKTPGPDGFPAEFYKIFWNDISDIVFQTYLEAFESGKLILSQRQGVLPRKVKT